MTTKTLRPDQFEDLSSLIATPRFLLLNDPGTGKTPTVCLYAYWLWKAHQKVTLWVMPNSLRDKNQEEMVEWTNFEPEDVVIIDQAHAPVTRGWTGPTFKRITRNKQVVESADLVAAQAGAKVVIVGTTFFRMNWEKLLDTFPVGTIVVDEFHMGFSTADSANTNALLNALRRVERFVAMTGTLVAGRLDSVYPAIAACDERYYPGGFDSFIGYHAEFIDEYGRVQGWQNLDKVKEILNRHGIRRSFEEIYGPESKVARVEWCEMGPLCRAAYDEFHTQGLLELEESWLDGTLPGVHLIRCRQIMEHPETIGIAKDEPIGKDERIRIHLEDARALGTAVVIFAALVPQQQRLYQFSRDMGLPTGLMAAETRDRGQVDADFREGRTQVLVASPRIASNGFNWAHVDHIIFASLDWRDVDFFQAYRRAMRGVRTKPLRITVLGYRNSVDSRIFEIVREGSVLANQVDPTREVFDFLLAA